MRISVVTACYNRAATIADAMQSLRRQSFQGYEHIIVDGGSTDGTLRTIATLADDRTKLVSRPDQGIYDALNKGYERAAGDVIGVLHSDDYYASRFILTHVARAFQDPDVDAVYGDLHYVRADRPERVVRTWRAGAFTPAALSRGWMPPHPTLFLRRRVVDALGPYDTTYRIAADYDAILRYFGSEGFRAVYVPEVFVKMRLGGASNGSMSRILQKSREDLRAIQRHGVGGTATLFAKNASKIGQFIRPEPMVWAKAGRTQRGSVDPADGHHLLRHLKTGLDRDPA